MLIDDPSWRGDRKCDSERRPVSLAVFEGENAVDSLNAAVIVGSDAMVLDVPFFQECMAGRQRGASHAVDLHVSEKAFPGDILPPCLDILDRLSFVPIVSGTFDGPPPGILVRESRLRSLLVEPVGNALETYLVSDP